VAGKRIRHLWRRDGADPRTFTAEAHQAAFQEMEEDNYSSRIESSMPLWTAAMGPVAAHPQNNDWYQYLRVNA